MEQKTEASQAVDEPVLPHLPRAVGYRHTMDNTEGIKGNKPQTVFAATKPNPFGVPGLDYSASFPVTTEMLFSASQMKEYARAALKAQPAPTKAAQKESAFKFRPWSKEAEMIEGWTAAEKARAAAQGEDSARLDAYSLPSMSSLCGCKACNQITTGRMMFICGKCGDKNCPSATNHLNKCMDRARASAETGGVKS